MMTIGEEHYASRLIHAIESVAKQLERLNNFIESASAGFNMTEKTEDKE